MKIGYQTLSKVLQWHRLQRQWVQDEWRMVSGTETNSNLSKQAELIISVKELKEIRKKIRLWNQRDFTGKTPELWIKSCAKCHSEIASQFNTFLNTYQITPKMLAIIRWVCAWRTSCRQLQADKTLPLLWKSLAEIIEASIYEHLQ